MGKSAFGDASVSDRLFGPVTFASVNWAAIGATRDVVAGSLWRIREYTTSCGVSDFPL